MVGRSNVGKSSLINALLGRTIARTSGAPGKTRLANIYRVDAKQAFYLVDLPGYGFARGGTDDLREVTGAYFGRVGQVGQVGQAGKNIEPLPDLPDRPDLSVLLLVDARHPGLPNDIEAWRWLTAMEKSGGIDATHVVVTKVDKLARGERIRAMREFESVLEHSVLPVSADTGEGLDELWTLISRWANSTLPKAAATSPPAETGPTRPTAKTVPAKKGPTRGRKKSSA